MTAKLSVPSLVDALHREIRDEILTGRLGGGEPLTELLLATRYSVARPTAKAALERLVHEGLLTRETNKTARVPLLSVDDIRDLYYARGFLEREIVVALCRQKTVPDAARESLQALRALTETPDVAQVVATDVAFHQALIDSLGSARLNRLYGSLMGEVHLCMAQVQAHNLLDPARIADEHEELLSAIEAGDSRLAIKLINFHLDAACTRLIGYLESDDSPEGRRALLRRRRLG